MSKWNLIIDVAKCHDCNNCFLSCKDEFCENDFPPYSVAQPWHGHKWIDIRRKERGQYPLVDVVYLPVPCMQCDEAPCVDGEAVHRREDGIVIIDPEKARGRKGILDSCPYGAIWWNEERSVAQKCTFCVHLLEDGWEQPRCVQSCPTGAMRFVKVNDQAMQTLVKEEDLEFYQPQYGTSPRVYYKNLYRFTKCFIAGNVALEDVDEVAAGAQVTLLDASRQVLAMTAANNYGDFRFDALEENGGLYTLEVEYEGYPKKELVVDLKESVSVGTLFL